MKRGPKPKPTAQKIREGNPGKRPLNMNEPKPLRVMSGAEVTLSGPAPPEPLTGDALTWWDAHASELTRTGVLTIVDMSALVACAKAWAEYVWCERELARAGTPILRSKEGHYFQHPLVAIRNRADERYRKWCAEFGLTPSSRSSIHADGPAIADPIEARLAARAQSRALEG